MDNLAPEVRSKVMAAVKSRDTSPEILVRRLVHGMGFRFRLHRRDLPGRPDIVFPSRRKIIMVHGCFWHRHRCRRGRSMPSSRVEFWKSKFASNVMRDRRIKHLLSRLGWSVLIVWECETRDTKRLTKMLSTFLNAES